MIRLALLMQWALGVGMTRAFPQPDYIGPAVW